MTPTDPTPLSAEELATLRRLAKSATPETKGRWRYRVSDLDRDYAYVEWGEKDAGYGTALLSKSMARYIAALSPDVVPRLLATLDARELDVERLATALVDVFPDMRSDVARMRAERAALRRGWDYRDMTVTGKGRRAGTSDRWAELLGVDWPMRQRDLKEAIPPAYTEWIGRQLLASLERAA